ncbi:MAG: hypothetical protein LBH13_02450 [Cellulomonadaceae bacterium]|jgi:hypothetical protein|nr:hypothetical protein [Cellulomonadaceae bacterium]
MGKLRFPNPGSDFDRLTYIFHLVASACEGTDPFDLDFMASVVAKKGQASSQGAQGQMALNRSSRPDRSRDPLYNQMKSYSELYRLFGWIRPTEEGRLHFRTTLIGDVVAAYAMNDSSLRGGLLREALLGMVFPNAVSQNIGVTNQRPLVFLLRLMGLLGGSITKNEIILGLLGCVDDCESDALEKSKVVIEQLRTSSASAATAAVEEFAVRESVTRETLSNYTRFPIAALSSSTIGWGTKTKHVDLYGGPESVHAVSLTRHGMETVASLGEMTDLRAQDVESLDIDSQADLASSMYYVMLKRAGLAEVDVDRGIAEYGMQASAALGLSGQSAMLWVLYNPFTQATDEVINRATGGDDK